LGIKSTVDNFNYLNVFPASAEKRIGPALAAIQTGFRRLCQ